jgi:hypothetical protein
MMDTGLKGKVALITGANNLSCCALWPPHGLRTVV